MTRDITIESGEHLHFYLKPKKQGIRILAGLLILRENVIKPVLAGLGNPRVGRPPENIQPIDQHYDNLHRELRRTFETLALTA